MRSAGTASGTDSALSGRKRAIPTLQPPGARLHRLAPGRAFDAAKDEEVVLQIVGMGPATSTPAEVK